MIYRGINSPSVGEGCGNGLCIKHQLQSVISSDLLELQMMNFVNIPDHCLLVVYFWCSYSAYG